MNSMQTKLKALYRIIDSDLDRDEPYIVVKHDDFGPVMPLDWVDTWIPELKEPWGKFMYGQTFCEHGFYVCDVLKFLYSKAKGEI